MPGKAVTILSAGRPFVCTCLPGSALDRLGTEIDAFLRTPPDAPDAMARAVAELLNDPARCADMGRRGRAWVEGHASRSAVLARYAALLLRDEAA